jgi:uncharacterized protein DUF6498
VNKLLNPAYWGRALSHPLVVLGLIVDLLPIYGVIAWGWNAVPLVMLYWMENVVAGVMTLPRIVISGASYGGVGLFAGLAMSVFFVFHYGLFCFVHGTFLVAFASISAGPEQLATASFGDMFSIFTFGLNSGLHVDWMIGIIALFQVAVFFWEFILKGEWKTTNPMAEMFAPYARIVILHFGIFAGAAALFFLGQPMVGVLALILFRAAWGIVTNSKRFGPEAALSSAVDNTSREKFAQMLKGKDPDAPPT